MNQQQQKQHGNNPGNVNINIGTNQALSPAMDHAKNQVDSIPPQLPGTKSDASPPSALKSPTIA
eukprot:CAMPEP_0183734622 /NCGR_PEP_ID=MMETSP0737-20130205/44323_1 /TAXON_ID=385413 /ORGANISM="Thalassiosira miniscula, Strain CCMP1093" /LENGTH=63 /DNA_ID=CAMNT_0025968155 /DNA_START=6 /DNA_END=194 /DNA_ORIENTATION=+